MLDRDGSQRRPSAQCCDRRSASGLPGRVCSEAAVADLPGRDEPVEAHHDLLDRHLVVVPVRPEHIDVVVPRRFKLSSTESTIAFWFVPRTVNGSSRIIPAAHLVPTTYSSR
jgi:hypothetical protein